MTKLPFIDDMDKPGRIRRAWFVIRYWWTGKLWCRTILPKWSIVSINWATGEAKKVWK